MCIVKGAFPENAVKRSMKFTRSRNMTVSHSNVIVAHGVLQTFDRCRPFHETKFSRLNVCTERFQIKSKSHNCFYPPSFSPDANIFICWFSRENDVILRHRRRNFHNKQAVCAGCEPLRSVAVYRGIVLFVFFACVTQIWIFAVNWHMDVCVQSGVDGDILLNQRLSVTDLQPSVVIVHVFGLLYFFLL